PASSTARGEEVDFGAIAPVHLLTERQRLVLAMLLEDDMTVPDVAQILKINEQTVRSTKHKAIERLRKAMEAES
ncbi:MAG: sigma factor-like helix-turn-helix DNA-binding protein, partial [Phycisphaerales bacterium]|nr:sigma factor-like helix-turn-helix DNA-binding protein [Phycisphaerales bacterium]